MTRRELLRLLGSGAVSLAAPGCSVSPPLSSAKTAAIMRAEPWGGLAVSLDGEKAYAPRVEGTLPKGLRGTLYRNGPGLFDRGGKRRRALLDGDGLVQSFRFGEDGVFFRARFVRTDKFVDEERAGRFVWATFSTQAPGGLLANVLPQRKIRSQAGVTVVPRWGRLFAFDEMSLPWELDPETGEWLHFGLEFGRKPRVHLTTFAADGSLAAHDAYPLPRFSYLHDWFVTRRHVVLHLHPATIEPFGLLLGLRSIVGSLRWRGEDGSLLMVLPRDRRGGATPRLVESEASFMWHSFNGHEEGDELVLDFVGYDDPDHFIGEDPLATAVMEGRRGRFEHPGCVRRFRIAPGAKRARNELLLAGNVEWPRIDDRLLGRRQRRGWVASGRPGRFFPNAVARVDFERGELGTFDFGDRVFATEPVFVPDPGRTGEEGGWLLVELYDGDTRRSSLAVLDAARIEDGPVARLLLEHHVPVSFHGSWRPEGASAGTRSPGRQGAIG